MYQVDNNIPSLGLFTEFYNRRIQLADDIDISVPVSAIGLIKQLLRHQPLSNDYLEPLDDLLIDGGGGDQEEVGGHQGPGCGEDKCDADSVGSEINESWMWMPFGRRSCQRSSRHSRCSGARSMPGRRGGISVAPMSWKEKQHQ